MKVLQVIPESRKGGGEKLALQLHEGLLARGVDSHIAIISGSVDGVKNANPLGARHPKSLLVYRRLNSYIRALAPDFVHTHMSPAQFLLSVCSLPADSLLVTTEHSTSNRRRSIPGGRIFDRWLYSRYKRIFCISNAVQQSLRTWLPTLDQKLTVVPNGVNLRQILYSEVPSRPLSFVSVGRLERVKDFDTAIVALSRCVGKFEFTYTIFGEGSLRCKLEATAYSLGLSSRIQFRGWSESLPSELRNFSALLAPSLWEGFGLAAVEAMSAGVPVFCSDIPGLSDIAVGESGFTFPAKDPEALAALLINFNRLPQDRHIALRRAAKERSRKYDLNKMIDGYLAAYEFIKS